MRTVLAIVAFMVCGSGASLPSAGEEQAPQRWLEITPGVWRTGQMPYGYALVAESRCLLVSVPSGVTPSSLPGSARHCDDVLLTHHHRDSSANAAEFVQAKIRVRAPRLSEAWLSPQGVAAYWEKSIPAVPADRFPTLFERSWADWTYLVHPEGTDGIAYDITADSAWAWQGWALRAVPAPGHAKDHTAYVATRGGEVICFCGDALASAGTVWSPYTMEWHHQQDAGALAAALSLRTIAALKPTLVLPEHGAPIRQAGVVPALLETADRLRQLGAARNYDQYTKSLPGPVPEYRFLATEQVGTANPQGNPVPWTKLSQHLFLSGNIYALASRDGPVLLVDAYSQNVVDRVQELQRDHGFGPVEVVTISHAHNDHYTGIFALPHRDSFQVWTLDRIAGVVDHPRRLLAPYVDPRSVQVDRMLRDGETVRWHEYELKIHHLPGQTVFAQGLETVVDGRRVVFTGDNFYHHEQYTGTGGWSGRNRGLPDGYVHSVDKLLAIEPDWVLAEHGGAFEFQRDDFLRRREFFRTAACLADALSPSGDHRIDWDPQRVCVEPLNLTAKSGRAVLCRFKVQNPSQTAVTYTVQPARRDVVGPFREQITVPANSGRELELTLRVRESVRPGRKVVPLQVSSNSGPDSSDTFVVLDVE